MMFRSRLVLLLTDLKKRFVCPECEHVFRAVPKADLRCPECDALVNP